MAKGQTHARVNLILIASTFVLYDRLGFDITLPIHVGTVLGWLVTPDADQEGITWEDRRLLNINKGIGKLWIWYWKGYAKTYSHRGISHMPIIGTAGRWLYVFWRGGFLLYFLELPVLWWLYIFAGHAFLDLMHLAFDGFKLYNTKEGKVYVKRKQRRSARNRARW